MQKVKPTVVFFGDSLTRADYLPEGFVDMLAARWRDARVLNHGVNGDTAANLLDRVGRVKAENPDWVWLMVGTNDCGWGVPPDQYESELRTLVLELRPARMVLVTPTTSVYSKGANAPYTVAVKRVGREEQLPVLDFAAEIRDTDYDFDGLHWNSEGHRRLAEAIGSWWEEKKSGN